MRKWLQDECKIKGDGFRNLTNPSKGFHFLMAILSAGRSAIIRRGVNLQTQIAELVVQAALDHANRGQDDFSRKTLPPCTIAKARQSLGLFVISRQAMLTENQATKQSSSAVISPEHLKYLEE